MLDTTLPVAWRMKMRWNGKKEDETSQNSAGAGRRK
jgi:hypothetical protein